MGQINEIVKLFNCGVRKRSNKFAQSALKKSNRIMDFITQNVLFYIQILQNLFKKYIYTTGVDIRCK
ncbi:hypothetical protein [Wolbachia endosymbiont of Litomosoides brasiliensis]|uniref:hypothetical protein n=1 Tax=Wolbachia endosymbiont of Litomosoides brasiliensis TaxID=1812117 RepID=UPI003979FB45